MNHTDCTCCQHWRAFEQPGADTDGDVVPYYVAQDWSPETVIIASRAGRRVRVMPPRLPARGA